MNKEILASLGRKALLSTILPISVGLASCDSGQTPDAIPAPIRIEDATEEEIIRRARLLGKGLVFFTISNYPITLNQEFQLRRVDISPENKSELDEQVINVNAIHGGPDLAPITSIFLTSSCSGEYALAKSKDGGITFEPIQVLVHPNKPPSNTFQLINCVQEFEIINAE